VVFETKGPVFVLLHGGYSRRRSPANQTTSVRDLCTVGCTTAQATFWFLNRPKPCSIDVAIFVQSSTQKQFSVFSWQRLVADPFFRRSSPASQTTSARANGSFRCSPQPAPSLFLVRTKPCPMFVAVTTLISVQKSVYRNTSCHVFSL
jgi:hypothetical protein